MPTILTSFADSEIRMRYREPFLTEGLDYKAAVNTPPGVYRGFRLATTGSSLSIQVTADAVASDHAVVYQTTDGHSLALRKTGGNFVLNLSAFASKTVVVAIYATYVLGVDTTADIRVYTLLPSDEYTTAAENAELVVLGTVVVPASGTIPALNITHDRRRPAWAAVASEAVAWSPILRNPSFEYGKTADSTGFAIVDWENRQDIESNGAFRLGTSTVRSGAKSLEFNKTAGTSAAELDQYQEIPVVPGQLIRIVGWVRQLIAPTAGTYTFKLYWGDLDSVPASSTSVTASASGTDAAYRKVEQTITVPTGVFVLKTFTIEVVGLTTASTGVTVVFDDVQVYVETGSPYALASAGNARLKSQMVSAMIFEEPDGYQIGELAALLRYAGPIADISQVPAVSNTAEGALVLERKDQTYDNTHTPPAFAILGRLWQLGAALLSVAGDARKARVSSPYSASFAWTLLWEALSDSGTGAGTRIYAASTGIVSLVFNASFDGTNWNKDASGIAASMWSLQAGLISQYAMVADTAWTTWTLVMKMQVAQTTTNSNPQFSPILALFNSGGFRRTAFDHNGLPGHHNLEYSQSWLVGNSATSTYPEGWTFGAAGSGSIKTIAEAGASGVPLRLALTTTAGGTDTCYAITTNFVQLSDGSSNPIGVVYSVLEWYAYTATPTSSTPSFVSGYGELSGASSHDGFFFKQDGANANWKVYLQATGGSSTIVDTGVAITTGKSLFRLEMYGSILDGGQRYLAYINGTLVASFTGADANVPTGDMKLLFFMSNNTTSGSTYFLGSVRYRCTENNADVAL